MGINVRKTPNWGKYRKRIKNVDEQIYKMSDSIITRIRNRTDSGVDKNNKRFKPYTKAYAQQKGMTRVNLAVEGHMLGAIDSKKITGGIRLYFNKTNENKKAHGNQIKYGRKFFGIDKKQKEHIKTRLGKFIVKTTR